MKIVTMIFMFALILGLNCVPKTFFVSKDFRFEHDSPQTIGIALKENPKMFRDSGGIEIFDLLKMSQNDFNKKFKEEFVYVFRDFSKFDSAFFLASKESVFADTMLMLDEKELEFIYCRNTQNRRHRFDYYLTLSNIEIHYTDKHLSRVLPIAMLPIGPAALVITVHDGSLVYTGKYVFTNTLTGQIVSFGQFTGYSSLGINTSYQEGLTDISKSILSYQPFRDLKTFPMNAERN